VLGDICRFLAKNRLLCGFYWSYFLFTELGVFFDTSEGAIKEAILQKTE
jgi:hypothetical protein